MLLTLGILERDLLPDAVLRFAIRRLLAERLREVDAGSDAEREARLSSLVEELRRSPIALATDTANEQHYELPTDFFQLVLGRHLKYSSCYWPEGVTDLGGAEAAMLELSAERAGLEDGQEILELGCGWGSLTFFMAERLPRARILAVSNSASQQRFLRAEAERRGLTNVELRLADMNDLVTDRSFDRRFDRVVSIEMLEHMRNYERLFERIAGWMHDDGRFFAHVFCHRRAAYPFEVSGSAGGPGDWMARHFFTGGLMPSADLFGRFDRHLEIEERWLLSGEHYRRTAEAWLANMDAERERILPILERTYGREQRRRWWVYWRLFFLACAELFGFRGGREWGVAHYRFKR